MGFLAGFFFFFFFLGSGGGSASWTEQNEFCGLLEIDTEYAPYLLAYVYLAWSVLSLTEAILEETVTEEVRKEHIEAEGDVDDRRGTR